MRIASLRGAFTVFLGGIALWWPCAVNGQTSFSLAIINPGPAAVEADSLVSLEIRATFTRRWSQPATTSASMEPQRRTTRRSVVRSAGCQRIDLHLPKQPEPWFDNNLPHQFVAQGPITEVLLDLTTSPTVYLLGLTC